MNFSTQTKKRRGLFNPNLDVRSVLESECYSVVFVYRYVEIFLHNETNLF